MSTLNKLSLLLSVFVLALAAYYPSLTIPFYLDDFDSILNNPLIRTVSWDVLHANYPMRELAYATFAWNYSLHEYSLTGYHLVNLSLHFAMGFTLFFLCYALKPFVSFSDQQWFVLAIVSAAIFLLAPLNTQPVVYIVQRIAQLSALFYLVGLLAYLRLRAAERPFSKMIWILVLLLSLIAGLMSKQNIVTLPISLLVLEFFLIKGTWSRYIPRAIFIGILVLLVFQVLDFVMQWEAFARLSSATAEAGRIDRWGYFTHQLTALWLYIYKFFVPYPLLLEYSSTPLSWQDDVTWYALIAFMALTWAVIKVGKHYPFIVPLVIIYFVAHSVESSFIPITDLVFEHRAYLPNAFLAMLVGGIATVVFQYRAKSVLIVLGVVLATNAILIFDRVSLWNDPLEFYRHELTHVADNSRSYAAVGMLYDQKGNAREATKWLQMAMQVGAKTGHLQIDTIINYMAKLYAQGELARANRTGVLALKSVTRNIDKARVLAMLSTIKSKQGLCNIADNLWARARRLDRGMPEKSGDACNTRGFMSEHSG